jgi:predicted permease
VLRNLRRLGSRIGGWVFRERGDADFEQELLTHLALLTEDNLRRGLPPDEAARRARIRLGGLSQLRESNRELRGLPFLETSLRDLGFAVRTLRRSPGFTAVAVATLALGIGATAAIFSAVYAVLLKPLPFAEADRLVAVWKKNPSRGWIRNPISDVEFLGWRERSQAFEDMAAFRPVSCVLRLGEEVEEDPCEVVASNLFPLLGVAPLHGRTFTADEDKEGAPPVVVLSYGLWRRCFGGEDAAIGRTIEVNGASRTIVGVMPASFSHAYASPYAEIPEMWLSGIALSPAHTWNDDLAVGRLRPGIRSAQAEARMEPISLAIGEADPELQGWRAQLVSLRGQESGDARAALAVLMGAVTFVLLIACANVASLLLARGVARANELAVRQALGASRLRLIRQQLTESLLLSAAGGALGVLLASWVAYALAALAPPFLLRSAPGLAAAAVDPRVLAFTVALSLVTTLLAGAAPAIQGARGHAVDTLKEAGRGAPQGPHGRRVRHALVVSEIALATVLLVGAGLMIRTLAGLRRAALGFDPKGVLTLRVSLSGSRYEDPRAQADFWRRVVASVEALPGVEAASVSRGLPIDGWGGQFFTTAENPDPPAGQVPDANYLVVGPDYFRALRIPLVEGRAFDDHDTSSGEPVVIVNAELARTQWPGQDPVGKRLRMGSPASTYPWLTVVGVADNVLTRGPEDGVQPEVYVPYQQLPWVLRPRHLVVRTASGADPAGLARATVDAIHRVDPGQAVADIQPMEEIAREPIAQRRMLMALLGGFAGLALLLSALGTYSVLSYVVAQRTREIGLRVALGAGPRDVVWLVTTSAARLGLLGIVLGVGGALALNRTIADLLFDVRATDPLTYVAVAVLLAASSLLAGYVPARRALAIDPVVALRYE